MLEKLINIVSQNALTILIIVACCHKSLEWYFHLSRYCQVDYKKKNIKEMLKIIIYLKRNFHQNNKNVKVVAIGKGLKTFSLKKIRFFVLLLLFDILGKIPIPQFYTSHPCQFLSCT